MGYFSVTELQERLQNFQAYLKANQIELAILTQASDILYYTGSVQPLYLLVSPDQALVLVRKSLDRSQKEIGHIPVKGFYDTKDLVKIISGSSFPLVKRLGFTLDIASYTTVVKLHSLFPQSEIADLSWPVRQLRMVKSAAEIAIYKNAKAMISGFPSFIKSAFKPGMTELEMSAEIERFFRLNGNGNMVKCRKEGIECLGICSAGTNSLASTKFDGICSGKGLSEAVPYGASKDIIPEKTPVIIDFGVNMNGYHIDVTRMFSWKQPSAKVMKAYDDMVEIHQAIIKELKPGYVWSDVYDYATGFADKKGYQKEFMGIGPEKVRFVGHGVGLELDEPPFLAPKMNYELAAGMTIAIEPKVALPDMGVIGIEDTVLIHSNGCEIITDCSNEFIIHS